MIAATKIRELNLNQPIQSGRPAFLSAASGLVRVGGYLYVIADDENHLAVFQNDGKSAGEVLRLFDGELPLEAKARKKAKPDLEAMTFLPPIAHPPHGALLCIPSGSKEQRRTGATISLDSQGRIQGNPDTIDLTPVFGFFDSHLGPQNIEAVAVFEESIYFLNRGNNKRRGDALIGLSLKPFLDSISNGRALKDADLVRNCPLDLGEISGVPLTPTDAIILPPGKLIFTAAAEATENSYDDGACHGSAVGVMDLDGKILFLDTVDTRRKLEGIDARVEGNRIALLLVNDEDSHTAPSELFEAYIKEK